MSEIIPPVPRIETELPAVEVFIPRPVPRHRYWLHLLLLLLTFGTTMLVGTRLELNFLQGKPIFSFGEDLIPLFPIHTVWHDPRLILLGLPFSLSLMAILLSHEMGHYIYCLRYGVYATLPYFIPAPTLIGTMGAFIRIKSPIRNRTALFDIGIAGPIAGFVVATLVLLFSLPMSKVTPFEGDIVFGYPLMFHLFHWFVWGNTQAVPLDHMLLHPMAVAAWVGMFATALNLLPGGQLDGGHIVYAVFPRAHRYVTVLTIGILLPMAWLSPSWILWAALIAISGFRHPPVPTWPDLPPNRRLLACLALLMLLLTFIPDLPRVR
ncbi:MAG TPA: site-2 protease family protein [Terriglobales bacterium]|nr:site-2 protease family protein [Terriglobales bacterium]